MFNKITWEKTTDINQTATRIKNRKVTTYKVSRKQWSKNENEKASRIIEKREETREIKDQKERKVKKQLETKEIK